MTKRTTHGKTKSGKPITDEMVEKLAKMPPERAAEIIVTKGILGGRARVLVGLDAHVVHHFARLTGSRYQNVVATLAKRTKPPKR